MNNISQQDNIDSENYVVLICSVEDILDELIDKRLELDGDDIPEYFYQTEEYQELERQARNIFDSERFREVFEDTLMQDWQLCLETALDDDLVQDIMDEN